MLRTPILAFLTVFAALMLAGCSVLAPGPTPTRTPAPTRTTAATRTATVTRTATRTRTPVPSATQRPVTALTFAGRSWRVKSSQMPVGPGLNLFSNNPEDVFVDAQGRLHLRITNRGGQWYSSEVISAGAYGYGTYTFQLAGSVDFDRNVVLGLFTWDDAAPQHNYREIDIEFSRFGEDAQTNAAYTVQPWQTEGNHTRFKVNLVPGNSTHSFTWRPESVQFSSEQGGRALHSWMYRGADIPPADGTTTEARINLWLLQPPADGQPVEVVIESFHYTPFIAPTATRKATASRTPTTVLAPSPIPPGCSPGIAFTSIPPVGSFATLVGVVRCVDPAQYKVAVYIQVNGGWWNKPTFASPLTGIGVNSTWMCDITTGGVDEKAAKIAAFLLPNGVNPPLLSGAASLPGLSYPSVVVTR